MLGKLLFAAAVLVLLAGCVWAAAALYLDCPWPVAGPISALAFAVFAVACVARLPRPGVAMGTITVGIYAVLAWWLTIQPSNHRNWQPDAAELAWGELDGERVTVHNVRHCLYRSEFDYTTQWQTRTVHLSNLRGIDMFLTYWGSPNIAHPILSFDFGREGRLAFSIETRKQSGEAYSAIRGFFRQYELIYTVADERDVIALRTNYRKGEDVYLFHTTVEPERAREVFLDYLRTINRLRHQPVWYNALTNNCTTSIRVHTLDSGAGLPWDWRLVASGRSGEMAYDLGLLAGNRSFFELKQSAYINPAIEPMPPSADWPRRIRLGRPGFRISHAPVSLR